MALFGNKISLQMKLAKGVEIRGKQEVQGLVSCKKRTERGTQERRRPHMYRQKQRMGDAAMGHRGLLGATRARGTVSSLKPSRGPADSSLQNFVILGDNKIVLL